MDLNNDHNVYILGAGFSTEAGLPVISDFLTRMRDSHPWLIDQKRKDEANAVQRVLEFRLQAAAAAYWSNLDLENIEELFSLASASVTNISDDIQLAIAATLHFAASTASTTRSNISTQSTPVEHTAWLKKATWIAPFGNTVNQFQLQQYVHYVAKLLGMFQDGRPKGYNTFITFNYDTVLEKALSDLELPFTYGLEEQDKYLDKSAVTSSRSDALKVLKLHGSLNWAKRIVDHKPAFKIFGNYWDVREAGLIPELVPPTWKKTFQGPIGDVWASAVRSLQTATRVVIIGFSMPTADLHFKYLIAAGLQQNVSLRQIVFVNPAAEELKQRAAMLFRGSYIESRKIVFESTHLAALAAQNNVLSMIGRPFYPDLRFY